MTTQIFSGSWNRSNLSALNSMFSSLTTSVGKTNRIFLLFMSGGTFYGLYQTVKAIQYKYFSFSAPNLEPKATQAFLLAQQIKALLIEGKATQAHQLYKECTALLNDSKPSNSFCRPETPDLRDQAILKLIDVYATNDQEKAFVLAQTVTSVEAALKAIENLTEREYKLANWKIAFQAYQRYYTYSVRILLRFAKVLHSSQNPEEIELKKLAIKEAVDHFKTLTKASDKADSLEAFAQYMQETKETSINLDPVDTTNMANSDKCRICFAQAVIAEAKGSNDKSRDMIYKLTDICNSEQNELAKIKYTHQLLKLALNELRESNPNLLNNIYSFADQKIAITNFTSPMDQLNTVKILLELLDLFKSIDSSKFSEMVNQVPSKVNDLSENNDQEKKAKIECYLRFSELLQEANFITEFSLDNFQRIYNTCNDFSIKQEIAILIFKTYNNLRAIA